MALKTFWLKLLNSITFNYTILENFLFTCRCNLLMEFSKSSLIIIKILINKKLRFQNKNKTYLIGHLIVLKSGSGLIFLDSVVFKIQNMKLNGKKNLIGIIEKYSTTLDIIALNNYFKILFLFNK